MTKEKKEEKKLIIDEDWKAEAKKEKEIMAKQEDEEKKAGREPQQRGPLPEGNMAAIISMLVTQAYFALGALRIKGHEQEQKEPDLEMAKYNIDMLETIQEKTKGNLTESEKKILKEAIGQLRMAYVKTAG
ncbi:MAG: DUF1844 domain-containing protein [Planctomycetota bacterium]|jgi:hypothetical protein